MAAIDINTGVGVSPNGTIWTCEHTTKFQRSKGIFFGDNPLTFTLPVLILQTSLVGLLTTGLKFLLTPLGQSSFLPYILAGLIMGPSVLGQIETVNKWLFPPKSFYVSQTIAFFGSMMFMFFVGIKLDISMVMRTGKKAWVIGMCSFVMPLIFSTCIALALRKLLPLDQNLHKSLIYIGFFLTTSSFHVTAIHLADLKLLNSEIGQIAISSATVSGLISALWVTSLFTHRQSTIAHSGTFNVTMFSWIVMLAFIVFVLRPIMLWMIRQTPEGKPVKESYIISVFLMLFGCAFFGELTGEHFLIGPIILGMAVPDGPPLGSALSERMDTMVSTVFLPLYFLFSGGRFKLFLLDTPGFVIVQVVAIFSFCGKVIGTMLPSIYYKMPLVDALSLGLLMSAQGITQLIYLQTCMALHVINEETYSNAVVALVWLTGATTPIVKFLYDPSKSYLSLNRRRTIEHASPNVELCLMACIHSQENTTSIINVLEMSNPSQESPICFYVMHLIQLKGRSSPLFIDHQPSSKTNNQLYSGHSQHIINAFRSYEQQNLGHVVVKLYTSISPYETMHDEICMQLAEKRASMLIVPFHRQWIPNRMTESAHRIRALNRHLLRTAPCSVGVLVERGALSRNNPLTCVSFYSVGMIFIEGSDDREALAFAMRMANHPNVRVTVIRLMEPRMKSKNLMGRDPDGDMIHKFMVDYIQIKRHDYREEIVRDSVEMINVVRSLEGCYDLILVGRRHASESLLFSGLKEWNEYPELGTVGDILVASDSTFDGSVLVVQQQKSFEVGVGHHDLHLAPIINYTKQESSTIVEMPRYTKMRII